MATITVARETTELQPEHDAETASQTFPEGGLKAWLALGGAFATMFCTFGYISTFAVFESYYYETLLPDNTHSELAWIGSIQTFFLSTTGMISGPLVDQFGTKPILIPFSILYVISIMLTSLCREYYQFLLAQGVLGGFSMGMLYTPSISILGHYFHRRRDLAIGISSAGSPLGGVIFPIALLRMIKYSDLGFAWSVRIIGFIMLIFTCVMCTTLTPRIAPRRGPHFLKEAFKSPVYVIQLIGFCLVFWGLYTPLFFLPSYAISKGVSVDWSFYIMPVYNSGSFIGRIACSRLTTYLGRYNTVIGAAFMFAIMLFCWIATTSLTGIIVLAIFFGISSGAFIGLFPAAVAMTAPRANEIGTYLGMTMGAIGVFSLTGSPMMGALVTRYDSFTPAIIFSGMSTVAGTILITIARIRHSGKAKIA